MKNLWPEKFEENNKPAAKNLLSEQAGLLSKLTGGIVAAEVSELADLQAVSMGHSNDFAFRFDLIGKFLEGYRFHVLSFSHDITLYPVKFRLDENIGAELSIKKTYNGHVEMIESPQALEAFLERVLTSKRIRDVVGSIMRLSK